jgi:hypothetical protein
LVVSRQDCNIGLPEQAMGWLPLRFRFVVVEDRPTEFSYRYPNLKTIRELIYKRGYGKVDRRRTPLTDNSIIEEVCSLVRCVGVLG